MKHFLSKPRCLAVFGLCLSTATFAQKSTSHDEAVQDAKNQNGVVSTNKKTFLGLAKNPDGTTVRNYAEDVNLNGHKESLVLWDECNGAGGLTAQVTWDYDPMRTEAALPKNAEDMVPCTKRPLSEAFANFLNDNMKYCIAAASLPSTQLAVTQSIDALKTKLGKTYKTAMSNEGGLVIDATLNTKLKAVFEKDKDLIAKEMASITDVKMLHQGIIGDERHTKRSYHSKLAMRAIDMSHLQVTRKYKDSDGKEIETTDLFQHNVSTFAEAQTIAGREKSLSEEQIVQHGFWQAFGACIQSKGGSVISNCLHHTGAGFKHQGHMHVSLPYDPPGAYNDK